MADSVGNILCKIQKCRKKKNLEFAKRLHVHICNNGLEADSSIENHTVPLFVDCGNVSDAQQAFNRLHHRNDHSWTSLIYGYVEYGQLQHAFTLYQKMQEDNIHPNSFTFTTLIRTCTLLKNIEKGQQIHADIKEKGFGKDIFIGSTLINMYVKCGLLMEAEEVFENLPDRNVVCWTAVIAGFVDHGLGWKALDYFEQMMVEGVRPNPLTFVFALKACSSIGAIDKGREIHSWISQMRFEEHLFVGSSLVDMYARCGALADARAVLNRLPVRNAVIWTTIITGYVEGGYGQEALDCFEEMQLDGVSPDVATFVCCLKACGRIRAIDKGREMHYAAAQRGFEKDRVFGSALVDMYAKCGSLCEAQEVFHKLGVRDAISWTSMIAGHAEHGSGQEALNCFEQMRLDGVIPDAVTYVCSLKACGSIGALDKGREIHLEVEQKGLLREPLVGNALIDMYAKCASLKEAREVFDKMPVQNTVSWNTLLWSYSDKELGLEALKCFRLMQLEGTPPNAVTYISIAKACGGLGAIIEGRKVHSEIVQKEFDKDLFLSNTLVDMYAKCGSVTEARDIFDRLDGRNVVSWTAIITGYVDIGLGEEALKCFREMQLEGVLPNAVTYVCILKACAIMGAMDKARELHIEIAEKGLEMDVFVGSTLVDVYSKGGLLLEAQVVFDKLSFPAVVSWNAMIRGHGMNYDSNMAINCFEAMQEQGIRPDPITFVCLLSACSRGNLVSKGQQYFKLMTDKYGILPQTDHYTCMIDLFARSGSLYAAKILLETAPSPLPEEALKALLSACKTYGEVELGSKCFQQLVRMNPDNSSSYVLMGNIYGTAGRWDEANAIEDQRKRAGAKKKPARALIEINKKVHEFVVGGDQSDEVLVMLETLSTRMKEEGYTPSLDLILKPVSDEGKEAALCGHAEKVAIAFGLLHTPQGQALHVSKNLRMCNDCHNASKIISKIENRKIVLRESNWIHHFKEGLCSCEDMW